MNSADYCVAQTRRRGIFIGNRIGVKTYHPKPILKEENYNTLRECINKYMSMKENKKINHIFTKHST
ncbi:MAG: hypothetical protein ACK5NF_05595 [Bacilli bacterium]